ncbi:MAG: hypothetical protein MRECE_35c023 [Mycoplasmataceae bacterium CE_OT135]|nr:MAG: hypothetical protein MRECE_39c010 [Mycoplasmataceae bacterium CE_OT135]KLL02966.1 MAG: hypothetical protein MRECE_35c023 [Mycoplasmataceae bacterium CE_OT135]
MPKFKFNWVNNTLAYQKLVEDLLWYEIPEENQFEGQFGSTGFKLDHGWISFTTYESKIRAFYKQIETPTWFTYYRKDLPKECPVIFEFTEDDEVEKTNGKWTKRGGDHA